MSDEEQKKIFSDNLNRYLELSGKSQKEVSDAIGVSPQTFNTWCRAIALPRMGKVQRLADYFGISKSDLIDKRNYQDNGNRLFLSNLEKNIILRFRKLSDGERAMFLRSLGLEDEDQEQNQENNLA